ncbi:MAG: prephenate dehydratase [Candidatus Methylomirabilota bacterium]|nr:prephenate dehydratase [Candidatus Methylomirabilis sp.]NJD68536.1 prephenate dehydratase [candidate division NC10 bacterium]PWB47928.1 MAG: prephenate dehydratase [candidate division NC10 bacterium]
MKITTLRRKIDQIDSKILSLLGDRAELVVQVGREKAKANLNVHVPQREEEIVTRLMRQNRGRFPAHAIRSVFREIISACRAVQGPLRLAYLGPEGTFTHLACTRRFGGSARSVPVHTIGEVFAEVEKGNVEYGIVPIENSSEGVVSHTLDMFVDSDLKICGEILLGVSHSLLSKSGDLRKVTKVYSHPHAFAQSRKWLEANLPRVPLFEAASTAAAAKLVAKDRTAAAIASELAATLYNLQVISRKIEDTPYNITRFLIIGRTVPPPTDHDKTSLMFSIKDRVGALYRILEPFAKYQINLTKVESRPSKTKAWEYIFYLDIEGHVADEPVREALGLLQEECLFLKVLGSYPRESSIET